MKSRLTILATAVSLMGVAPAASGQERANRLQTNLTGVTTVAAPPAGFNHVTASDAELEQYGFPPRPNETLEPKAYKSWTRAMAASKLRISPLLEQTELFHGPAQQMMSSQGTSNNWSAAVDFSGATSYNYASSFRYIVFDYVVPVATQAYGACTGTWDFSSTWIGIDGARSNDVLQAGTESDAYCGQGGPASYYAAWYEWFPYGEVRIKNFPVAPGDDLFVEVWNTNAVQGYAYFANFTTNQAITLGFNAPAGTTLVGNSAEWVVERPGVNGGLATLTNYVSDYLSNCFAATWNQVSHTPGDPSTVQLTMLDENSQPISSPTVLGSSAIWFQDQGSARSTVADGPAQ